MRLGVFGGTFDPIHLGHLILAEHCRDAHALDQVLLVPAGQPPHKSDRQITSGRQRMEMVELAIAGHAGLAASPIEIERSGLSYTVETLEELARRHADTELHLLMGADSVADLPNWYQPARIAQLATLVVAARPGVDTANWGSLRGVLGEAAIDRMLAHRVEMPLIQISSSGVRARVATGRSVRYLVPRAVECYISQHSLYRP